LLRSQGNELGVLLGANETLRRWRPMVYAEEHSRTPQNSPVVLQLSQWGFDVFYHLFCSDIVDKCRRRGTQKAAALSAPPPADAVYRDARFTEANVLAIPREARLDATRTMPALKSMRLLRPAVQYADK